MKTLDQIILHATNCSFSREDWGKVKEFCFNYENGGHVHKGKTPVSTSSYDDFLNWIEKGFGSGEIVRYGDMIGMIGDNTPDKTYLVAYYDFDRNVIVKEMKVLEPRRLQRATEEEEMGFRKAFFEAGWDYDVKEGRVSAVCTPKINLYYSYGDTNKGKSNVGIYVETKLGKYHFYCFLKDGKILINHWVDINCTPLRPATDKEIMKLQAAMKRKGVMFDPNRGGLLSKGKYWYMSDRLEVVMDKDDGKKKRHKDRYQAGNYFLSLESAAEFVKNVKRIMKGED